MFVEFLISISAFLAFFYHFTLTKKKTKIYFNSCNSTHTSHCKIEKSGQFYTFYPDEDCANNILGHD